MRKRHWHQLASAVGAPAGSFLEGSSAGSSPSSLPSSSSSPSPSVTSVADLLAIDLPSKAAAVAAVVERARREVGVERALQRIATTWSSLALTFAPFGATGVAAAAPPPALADALEGDALTLQNLASSRLAASNPEFIGAVSLWSRRISAVDALLCAWAATQRKWQALQAIFAGSEDLRARLPAESRRFDAADADFRALMREAASQSPLVIDAAAVAGRVPRLERQLEELEGCEKALQGYLEAKRVAFPRFYFVSPADLLDLLARGADAHAVERYGLFLFCPLCVLPSSLCSDPEKLETRKKTRQKKNSLSPPSHLPKAFDNVHSLEWRKDPLTGRKIRVALGMYSGEGEYVPFVEPVDCGDGGGDGDGGEHSGAPVEVWMARLVAAMRAAMADDFRRGVSSYDDSAPPPARTAWILGHCAQTAATVSRAYYAAAVGAAFRDAEAGDDGALAAELARQRAQLADLIATVARSDLSANDRRKLITLCTIDVHARDVLAALVDERGSTADCFRWASQLRYYSDAATGDCSVQICDAEVAYGYEYVGNCGCLCITPLTDRCYITLTQAQRLVLGGAPAGPAGTGKTETTKDLARALGFQCYVFNCSDQMDFRAMGTIYRGLAQTGAWGCFDEFNRISVSVLSVCSTQYKSVLDALRARAETFVFEGVETRLKPNAMAFITMNPGYAGRAELPESLKVKERGRESEGGREGEEKRKRTSSIFFFCE